MEKRKIFNFFLCFLAGVFFVICLFVAYYAYIFYKPNIYTQGEERVSVAIPEGVETAEELIEILSEKVSIKSLWSMKKAFEKEKYKILRSGNYELTNKMCNKELVRMIHRGLQTSVKVTFNNLRTKEQLAGVLSAQLMADSLTLLTLFNDSAFLSSYDLNPDNVLVIFIPNTYDFYWNTSEKRLFDRMYKEHAGFWNEERREKAKQIPLTPIEVSILASIVEEETSRSFELRTVAGLYINRLKKNMFLQADPTVKFACGNMEKRRVLREDLKIDSPYNTYKYRGLPPGPIRIPAIETIEAVLNYEHHNYLYMAAKETFNGEHNFAATWREHTQNAQKYRRELNRLRIYK